MRSHSARLPLRFDPHDTAEAMNISVKRHADFFRQGEYKIDGNTSLQLFLSPKIQSTKAHIQEVRALRKSGKFALLGMPTEVSSRASRFPAARVTVRMREEYAGKANSGGGFPEKRSRPHADSHKTSGPVMPGDLPELELQMFARLLA